MLIFAYEYTCAVVSTKERGADSLQAEGRAMLCAIMEDLRSIPGVQAITLLDPSNKRLANDLPARFVSSSEEGCFRELARQADYTFVIAPESDQALSLRCRWVEEVGRRSLGSSVAAIELTGDKLKFGEFLGERGLPTPGCIALAERTPPIADNFYPGVCKPRFGAGSQATFLVRSPQEAADAVAAARQEGWPDDMLLQSFAPGQPASVALLVGRSQHVALLPAAQTLSTDGRFRYLGGTIPLPASLAERAARLASQVVHVLPGLRGWVGIDLVLGKATDGNEDQIIELNPRLTTSYVGLRALSRTNLARMILQAVLEDKMASPSWRPDRIQFSANGVVATC